MLAARPRSRFDDWAVCCRKSARGYGTSLWKIGGLRWKATGNTRLWGRCCHRGKRGLVTLERGE